MPASRSLEHRAFGLAVRHYRLQLGWSQEELGHRSGLHRNYVGGVERGELNASLTNIHRLAKALDVKTSDLFALAETLASTSADDE